MPIELDLLFIGFGLLLLIPGLLILKGNLLSYLYDDRRGAALLTAAGAVMFAVGIVDFFNLYPYLHFLLKYWEY